MKYDSLIFDLDGTMWSSAENVYNAIVKMKKEFPEIRTFTQEDCRKTMGFSNKQTQDFYFNEFPLKKGEMLCIEFLKKITADIITNGAEVYPDTINTLKQLKDKYRLFIVSNCGHGFVEAFMKQTKTEDLFEDYEYCARTGFDKGTNISLIVKRNNLKTPAYVGDTAIDKEASEKANVDFIYAEYGFGNLNCTNTIKSFSELLNL